MVENVPDTAYVHHAWSGSNWDPIIAALYRNKLAAIHFGEYPVSFDSSEWDQVTGDSTKTNSMQRLCDYVKEGRILAVSYTGHTDLTGGRYVGTAGSTHPSSQQESSEMLLLVCRYGDQVNSDGVIVDQITVPHSADQNQVKTRVDDLNDEAREYVESVIENEGSPEELKEYKILKGFSLNKADVEWVWNRDFPGLWAANKRGTLMGWRTGDQHLYAAYYSAVSDEVNLDRLDEVYDVIQRDKSSVWVLSEGQLEALCSEYLRRNYDNYVEFISAGGSLSEADIFGGIETTSREIIAQVTFETGANTVKSKLRHLLAYEDNESDVDIWFFGPQKVQENLPSQINNIKVSDIYRPIETVFEELETSLAPDYIELLLNIELTPGRPSI